LTPEQLLARLTPEQRLNGLTPEQLLEGLSPEQLRSLAHNIEHQSHKSKKDTGIVESKPKTKKK
jgi:hypothetical protein